MQCATISAGIYACDPGVYRGYDAFPTVHHIRWRPVNCRWIRTGYLHVNRGNAIVYILQNNNWHHYKKIYKSISNLTSTLLFPNYEIIEVSYLSSIWSYFASYTRWCCGTTRYVYTIQFDSRDVIVVTLRVSLPRTTLKRSYSYKCL